jgi:quercetin dioxygenase-like cupin family protein
MRKGAGVTAKIVLGYLAMRLPTLLALMILVSLGVTAVAGETKPPAVTQAVPGIKRTILQKFEVPGTNYESTFMKVEFDPNLDVPRHTHPGPEASLVLEGEITLILDGQEPRLLKPGDTTYFPPAIIHSGKVGPKGVTLLNSYILEKGKPFMTKVDASGAPIP